MSMYPSSDMEKQSLFEQESFWQSMEQNADISDVLEQNDLEFGQDAFEQDTPTCSAAAWGKKQILRAVISAVAPDSPAYDAGFEPGCCITAVNGAPLRDIIDWRWQSADDTVSLSYIDLEGDSGEITLEREPGEEWGIEFDGVAII